MRTKNIYSTRTAGKKIAQRTCVACRQMRDKKEMVRLVRTPEGDIIIDRRGKSEGRGAYLCPARQCWEKALQGKQLEQALRGSLSQDGRTRLMESGRNLLKGDNQW